MIGKRAYEEQTTKLKAFDLEEGTFFQKKVGKCPALPIDVYCMNTCCLDNHNSWDNLEMSSRGCLINFFIIACTFYTVVVRCNKNIAMVIKYF